MKKFKFVILAFLAFFFSACNKDEITTQSEKELFLKTEYNLKLKDFTLAIQKALIESVELREIVRKNVMEKFDGDYNTLLEHIIDEEIKGGYIGKKSRGATVRNLLETHLEKASATVSTKSGISIIDQLLKEFPGLQIAIPVHAASWDGSYVPPVTFIPEEFSSETTHITAWHSDGSIMNLSTRVDPEFAFIVIGINERRGISDTENLLSEIPNAPINLSAITTESGIGLIWQMPSGTAPGSIVGYHVFRKSAGQAHFSFIGSSQGFPNKIFNDNNTVPAVSYSYYVVAFNHMHNSSPSNIVSITAPFRPNPPSSFRAIHHNINLTELRWENYHRQFIGETRVYRALLGTINPTPGYIRWGTFDRNQSVAWDNDLTPGMKHLYKINHYSPMGVSNSKFYHIQVPFRDISRPSPVYIKRIRFTSPIRYIESWLGGAPEFYINAFNTSKPANMPLHLMDNKRIDFDRRSSYSQVLHGIRVIDWRPSFLYDMISFHAHEGDWRSNQYWQVAVKFESMTPLNDRRITHFTTATVRISGKDNIIGSGFLSYFDNTNKHGTTAQPGTWIDFQLYGFQIFVSEIDW